MLSNAAEAAIAGNVESFPIHRGVEPARNIGFTFGELRELDLPRPEPVIYGLSRGQWGIWNAVTNKGKTTMLRNLMACLVTRRGFPPLLEANHEPRRVTFIDFEDDLASIKKDCLIMTQNFTVDEMRLFDENTYFIADVRNAFDEDLSLSSKDDFQTVLGSVKQFRPDIVFVDTLGSGFTIRNENDNAEIRERITRPLKKLAKDANAALIVTHHIGKAKSEEGHTREASHKGRGASSLSDMPKVVLNLEHDPIDDSVTLQCAKVKGIKFPDMKFKLDTFSRWFQLIGEVEPVSCYGEMLKMFEDQTEYETAEIVREHEGVYSERAVKDVLRRAVDNQDLIKVRRGVYRKPKESEKVQVVQLV